MVGDGRTAQRWRDLVVGQLWLFGGLTVCIALRPQGLTENAGISYYGVHWETVGPYAAGLLGAAAYTRRGLREAASELPASGFVRCTGDAFAVLLVGVVATPYTAGVLVDWTHRGFGASLFVLQLMLAVRLAAGSFGPRRRDLPVPGGLPSALPDPASEPHRGAS